MIKKITFLLLLSVLSLYMVTAQTLLNENFNYKAGQLTSLSGGANVSGGNWTSFSGTGSPFQVIGGNLSYPNYDSSVIGNSITMVGTTASAEDVYRNFPSQTLKTVYFSFLIKLTDTVGLAASTSSIPEYFAAFLPSTSTTTFYSRLTIRKSATTNGYQLGLRSTATGSYIYAPQNLGVDTVQLIVLAYTGVSGTNNDTAMLWVNPSTVSMPTPDAKGVTAGGDAFDISRIVFRQGNAGTPNATIDGAHVALSWGDVMGSTISAPAPANSGTTIAYLNNILYSWNRPGDYDPATMQTLVFAKRVSTVNTGAPNLLPGSYISNTDFNGNGTPFQFDTSSRCVMNGDSNNVFISGLQLGTVYNIAVYIVRTTDTAYSSVFNLGTTTQNKKPNNLTSVQFTNTSYTSTTLNWARPIGYIDSNMTVLIFFKPTSTVSPTGTVNASPNVYSPNPNYSQYATPFVNDTLAKAVYVGDGTNVTITGLTPGTIYYAGYYVVRSLDTVFYSNLGNMGMITTSQAPPVSGLNVNATGQNTATIIWTKPANYNNNSMTTLVFVKKEAAISTIPFPARSSTIYSANADFTANGTPFIYDTLAKCAMNTDSNFVNITGLTLNTNYYVLVYVVRTADSAYSPAMVANGMTFGAVAPPKPLTAIKVNANTSSTAELSWTKDSTFTDSTTTILVFVKKGIAVIQGAPDANVSNYTASNTVVGGTAFQNDTAAHCVYKGNGTNVSITGLAAGTTYYAVAYAVRIADSSYANAVSNYGITVINPATSIGFIGQSATSTRVTWIKPANYINANYSTLVFVKADNAITAGTPTRIPTSYIVNAAFGVGSKYQNDTLAYCVFRADTNFVNISGLVQNRTYYAMVLVVRDADSVYAASASGTVSTLPPPAWIQIGKVNSTNATTGNADSLNVRVLLRGVVYGFNQATTGLRFMMHDNTGGITVINTTKNFGYSVSEGDSIEVQGTIGSSRGLNIVTIDTLNYKSSFSTIKNPVVVNKLSEATDNDLVRVNAVSFLTPPTGGTWTPTTYSCIVRATGDTITIRINTTNPIVGSNLPTTQKFSVIGMGSQVSTSNVAPFLFNGYQLLPRKLEDIIEIQVDSLTPFTLSNPLNNATAILQGASSNALTFNWTRSTFSGTGNVVYTLQMDTAGGNFSTPRMSNLSNSAGADTIYTITSLDLSSLLGMKPVSNWHLIWRVVANVNSINRNSVAANALTITRNYFTGVTTFNKGVSFNLYPNPAGASIQIVGVSMLGEITICDQLGKEVMYLNTSANSIQLETTKLERGVYFVIVKSESGTSVQKLLLQ